MRSFALNFAGVALVGLFLGCGSTKKAGDGGAAGSGGVGAGTGGIGTTSSGGSSSTTSSGGNIATTPSGGSIASTGGAGAGGAGGVTAKGGAGGAGGVTTATGDAAVYLGTGGSADFANRYIDAFCSFFTKCAARPSVAACRADYFDSGLVSLTAITQAIDTGRIIYNSGQAATCFDAIANGSCAQGVLVNGNKLDATCANVLKGTVADGAACVADPECTSGVCHQPSCGADCCLGTCGPPPSVGTACSSSSDCVDADYCDFSDPLSSQGSCQPRLAQGQPCSYDTYCLQGLDCDSAGTGTCVPYVKDGQPCTVDGPQCENISSFCDPQSGTCRPRLAVGAPCTVPDGGLPLPEPGCVYYAACVGGTCVALPGRGEACTVPDGGFVYFACRSGPCTDGVCASYASSPCTLAIATAPDAGARD